MLSRRTRSAWAKFDRETDEWLSLARHCEDAADVAGYLWDDWLPASTKKVLIGSGGEQHTKILARFLAGTHDVGKLSPAFACQVDSLCGPMRDAGLRFPSAIIKHSDAPHSVVGFRAVEDFLIDRGFDRRTARSYASISGGHHGMPPKVSQVGRGRDRLEMHYGGREWAESRSELIEHVAETTGAGDLLDAWCRNPLTVVQQVLWTGLVIMADWIASNSDLFPLTGHDDSVGVAAAAWAALDLPAPWLPDPVINLGSLMANRFDLPAGASPNPMQEAVVSAARAMETPGMLIVESTMGSGKTEAALAAAEHLADKFGAGGLFVALPTMATSNAMFARVQRWLANQNSDSTSSLILAHGKSHLNKNFGALERVSKLVDVGRDDIDEGDRHECGAEVIAHQWFFGRKRSMLSGFVVGTIDQLLFGGLKAKHVVLRHLAMSNKIVILDEVHAADDYMRVYLHRVLEWLAAYKVSVILLSATLPSAQRVALVEAYERGKGLSSPEGDDVAGDIGYPAVTSVADRRSVTVVEKGASTQVIVELLDEGDEGLVDLLRMALVDGGSIAVIRNTVRRAQATFRMLRAEFGDDVVLIHSRFAAQHRATLEADLVHELGRGGSRRRRRVVVATQVIEQSLDLDFDLLVTDLAPIDLVLQRIGRLHRHSRDRPPTMRQARVVVTGVAQWSAAPPVPDRGLVSVYGASRLLRSAAALVNRGAIEVPLDLPGLVQTAYSANFESPVGWESAVVAADLLHESRVADQRERASTWLLSGPTSGSDLVDWLAQHVGEVDDPRGYAKVRDSEEGVEVLLTRRVGGEVYLLSQCGGERVETDFEPLPAWRARAVLNSAIRLPAELCRPGQIDKTIAELEKRMYDGWQGSKWLAGELVVELNEEGSCTVGDFVLTYDGLEGLLIDKAELH